MNFLGGCGNFGYSYFHLIYSPMISLTENVIGRAAANLLYSRPQIPKWQGEGGGFDSVFSCRCPFAHGFFLNMLVKQCLFSPIRS